MLTYSAKVIIAMLSLVIMSSAVIQTSYSQQPTSDSSLGLTMISNNSQTASTPNIMKYEAAREQFLKVWDQLEFEPLVSYICECIRCDREWSISRTFKCFRSWRRNSSVCATDWFWSQTNTRTKRRKIIFDELYRRHCSK